MMDRVLSPSNAIPNSGNANSLANSMRAADSSIDRNSVAVLPRPQVAFSTRSLGRAAGIAFGIGTQLLFAFTVVHLFLFLKDGETSFGKSWIPITPGGWTGVLVNTSLALFFAWPHSLLLAPPIQKRIKAHLPAGLLGCVHCSTTCLSLLLMFAMWHKSHSGIWAWSGPLEVLMRIGFYGSWVALFYSLYWTGLGYQTGLTQWWYWFHETPAPRRAFVERGPYRFLRHPVYLSFLGLIWFTPNMSWDHVILTSIWTLYIFLGSYFKDRRLLLFLGDNYREYASRIPGYPLIGFGPMGRLPRNIPR